jgi:hypothetical protein
MLSSVRRKGLVLFKAVRPTWMLARSPQTVHRNRRLLDGRTGWIEADLEPSLRFLGRFQNA